MDEGLLVRRGHQIRPDGRILDQAAADERLDQLRRVAAEIPLDQALDRSQDATGEGNGGECSGVTVGYRLAP